MAVRIVPGLDAEDLGDFESAATETAEAVARSLDDSGSLLDGALSELAGSPVQGEELHRRTRRFFELLPEDPRVHRALAVAARTARQEIKSAVVAESPPALRRLVYSEGPSDASVPEGAVSPEPLAPESHPETRRESEDVPDDWQTVLLLGERQDTEVNARFLTPRGFVPLPVTGMETLEALAGERYCGIVVYRSWRGNVPESDLTAFLRTRLAQANIVFYRVDSDGLGAADSAALLQMLDEHGERVKAHVKVADGPRLTELDVAEMRRISSLLASSEGASLTVDGLSPDERRLLTAAVATFDAASRGLPAREAHDTAVSPLLEGRSGARVLRLTIGGGRSVVVAKLDEVTKLRGEMERTRIVTPPDQLLPMDVYSLDGAAVLIQQLVGDADQRVQAAPSLKERVELRAAWERGRRYGAQPPEKEHLLVGLERAFGALREINERAAGSVEQQCWTGTEPLTYLAELGIEWKLEADDGEFDPAAPLDWVTAKIDELEAGRMVHGDLHWGNVLLPDDRTPRLIDFAHAGAGHPAFDLVRLSSAVAYSAIRPLVKEERLREFFTSVHFSTVNVDELKRSFPDVVVGDSAEVAASALVLARDIACDLLASAPKPDEHYAAMVYLVGVQSLTMSEYQAAVVRAALGAVKPWLASNT